MNLIKKTVQSIVYGNRMLGIVRILMGILFIYSGIFKVLSPADFGRMVMRYNIIPDPLIPYFAIYLPYLELLLGVLLLIGFRIRPATLLSILMMLIFTIAIAVNVVRGETFDCGCFELSRFGIKENISISLIIRDLVFIAIYILLFRAKKHYFSLDGYIEKEELTNI